MAHWIRFEHRGRTGFGTLEGETIAVHDGDMFDDPRPSGETLPMAYPGQYISVAVRLPDGARQIRQYSLTRAPERAQWGITVKAIPETVDEDGNRIPAGEVSNFLHQNVFEGDTLTVSPPFGDLVLDTSDAPLLLISAGIGCTPIIGMLHYLARTSATRHVTVLHADRSPARHAHRRELKELVERLPGASLYQWYEDLGVRAATDTMRPGRIDLGHRPQRCRRRRLYPRPVVVGRRPRQRLQRQVRLDLAAQPHDALADHVEADAASGQLVGGLARGHARLEDGVRRRLHGTTIKRDAFHRLGLNQRRAQRQTHTTGSNYDDVFAHAPRTSTPLRRCSLPSAARGRRATTAMEPSCSAR